MAPLFAVRTERFVCITALNECYMLFPDRIESPGYEYELLLVYLNLYYEYNI